MGRSWKAWVQVSHSLTRGSPWMDYAAEGSPWKTPPDPASCFASAHNGPWEVALLPVQVPRAQVLLAGGEVGDTEVTAWLQVPVLPPCPPGGRAGLAGTRIAWGGCGRVPEGRGRRAAGTLPSHTQDKVAQKSTSCQKISFLFLPLLLGCFPNLAKMNVYHLLRHQRIELQFL